MSETAEPGYADHTAVLLKRLHRAEGQVRGVARLVEEQTYCIDVLTQISAAQAALDRVAIELVRDHARHCVSGDPDGSVNAGAKADELVDAISRLMSR